MKIALVHDYLTQLGGAEKVLQNLQEVFKDSPVFVLVSDKKISGQIFNQTHITSSWLQNLPFAVSHYQWYLTLMPRAVESHSLNDFDVVISSASSIAKGIKLMPDALHICYCHTPTRYLWHDAQHYVEESKYNLLVKKIIPLFLNRLRHWDFWLPGALIILSPIPALSMNGLKNIMAVTAKLFTRLLTRKNFIFLSGLIITI